MLKLTYYWADPLKWRRNLAQLEKWEAIDHNKTNILNYSPVTPESIIFSANTSCILTPTITDGPYYVWGEVMRQNVKEEKYSDGVDIFLEVQYIDINTCRPVPGALVDIWQANATGVYRSVLFLNPANPKLPCQMCQSDPRVVVFRRRATTPPTDGTRLTCVVFSKPTATV
jgi:protocatechuate 3,4-dioxygenase beta subunit